MANQVWLPVDGALLKKLREEAGVEITTLARTHSLSTTQVKQLEDGGDSGFYTAAIKLATGRKLLVYFGADVAPVEQAPEEYEIQAEISLEIPGEQADVTQASFWDVEKTKNYLRFLIPSIAVICLGFAFFSVYTTRTTHESKLDDPAQQTTLTPSTLATPIESKTVEVVASTLPEVSAKAFNESSAECKWNDEAISVYGYQPTKAGDYVHVVAKADSPICVRDALGKLQVLRLKSSQSQTVRGRPPFQIFSDDLHQFQLFYQGNLLRLPSHGVKNITLKEQKYE